MHENRSALMSRDGNCPVVILESDSDAERGRSINEARNEGANHAFLRTSMLVSHVFWVLLHTKNRLRGLVGRDTDPT